MRNLVVGLVVAIASIAAPARALALQHIEGSAGALSRYGIWVPDRWNGDLVLYAHGFHNPNCPVAVPTDPVVPTAACPDPESGTPPQVTVVRDTLLSFGYAFAASSYSRSGFAVKEGVHATLGLKGIFSRRIGRPARTFLYGHSMGGAVVLKLAEQHPRAFDGALVMCGMIGGSTAEMQYAVNARATFDYFFPGVLPPGIATAPPGLTFYGDILPTVLALFDPSQPDVDRLLLNFDQATRWAASDQVAFPALSATELVQGILEILYDQTLATPGVVEAAGGFPVTNEGVQYQWTSPAGALLSVNADEVNRDVERVPASPIAAAWAKDWYDPTGAISFPVLTVHTIRDAAVPMLHERLYAERVAAAGRPQLLVQRTVNHDPRSAVDGHCTFKPAEELTALADLLQWVGTGARPAGGDATIDVADPPSVSLPRGIRSVRCHDDDDDEDGNGWRDDREGRGEGRTGLRDCRS